MLYIEKTKAQCNSRMKKMVVFSALKIVSRFLSLAQTKMHILAILNHNQSLLNKLSV